MKPPRSIYAQKLSEFAHIALGDETAFSRRGRWNDYFRDRIGPAFGGRVVLEIGCADAALLSSVAARYPADAFVGLDWKCKAIYEAAARVAAENLANVALLRARAQDLARLFDERELDEIWIFHPDPCDRDIELQNRLISEPFLAAVHRALRDRNSRLCLKTDHPGYYQWVLGLLGLPEPRWFSDPGPMTPKVRGRDLMRRQDVPPASDLVRRCFRVAANSPDFWHDAAVRAHTDSHRFAGEATRFETRFQKKRLPIYYIELQKR